MRLWTLWHYQLGEIQRGVTGSSGIFMLRGEQFDPAYPANFQRSLEERGEIEALLLAGRENPGDMARLAAAEKFIDAFYSFEPSALHDSMKDAAGSKPELVFYQGWAQGGNYKIVKRGECAHRDADTVACPITVEDDLAKVLRLGFNVTDTFVLTFSGQTITAITTESDDPEQYFAAKKWVQQHQPQVFTGPCNGIFAGGATPGDCVRAMVSGFAEFMRTQ